MDSEIKKTRSRAIPPVIVQCEEHWVERLHTSIKKSIDALSADKLMPHYNLGDGKIQSLEFHADALDAHKLVYTKSSLMCDDNSLHWTYRPHLPLSQLPEPHGAPDVIKVLKMAQRTVERVYSQSLPRFRKTIETNDPIIDLITHWASTLADNLKAVSIDFNNATRSILCDPRNPMTEKDNRIIQPWLDQLMPCLFISRNQNNVIFGCGSVRRELPLSPMEAMQAIAHVSAKYPDIQLPSRA